ncbi:NADH-quinone oxidoreductase subunit C [Symbiobacterium terraclitae]|uniref:NADH-quinone oxidoreductase subunit C n=1 Tax=Symbiobacterium terraclitae TaxID=557451 RepID=UPI0035B52D31
MANAMHERVDAARERVINEVIPALLEAFPGKVEVIPMTNDRIPQVYVASDVHLPVALWLKERGFHMLVDITAADYYPKREPRFELVYHLREMPAQDPKGAKGLGMIRVRVKLDEREPVHTLSHIWAMANAAEREIWDQFGLNIVNHPNLTRILNPDDWEGHPLRRDYPLRGPRALISLEMPADENRYHPFVETEPAKEGE